VTHNEKAGIAWWNGLDAADRRFWLAAAVSPVATRTACPADAWAYFQRCAVAA